MDLAQYKVQLFYLALFFVYPVSRVAYKNIKFRKFLIALTIFSTLLLYKYLDINFISAEIYRGTVRGFEISAIDLMVLSLFLALQYDKSKKKQLVIPGFWPNLIYIGCAFMSLYFSNAPVSLVYGYFAIFQYLRGLFYYWTLYHLIENESDFHLIINTLICAAFYNAFIALQHRYVYHFHRIGGLFGHPNILGAYSNMVGLFLLFMFRENIKKKSNWFLFAGAGLSLITVILSISRGAIATSLAGIMLILGTMYLGRSELSVKKIAASIAIIFIISIIWFNASDTILSRWTAGNPAGDEGRILMSKIASKFGDLSLFGCGINNFSYTSEAVVGYALPPAHSVYYLTLAEMGYPGLIVFISIWLRFIFMGLKQFFVKRRSLINSVIKAAVIVCMVLLINSSKEDHPRRTSIMYLYAVFWACIAKGTLILKKEEKQNETEDYSHPAPVC